MASRATKRRENNFFIKQNELKVNYVNNNRLHQVKQ